MEGVVGDLFDRHKQAGWVTPVEGVDNLRADSAAALMQETRVGHLLGEHVGERVGRLGEEAGLIEQFGGLHVP